MTLEQAPGTYQPLTVEMPGQKPAVVPNYMSDELWVETMAVITRDRQERVAELPDGQLTDDTLLVEQLGVASVKAVALTLKLRKFWRGETGEKVGLPTALIDTMRRVSHIRDAYNLVHLADADVANAYVAQRVRLIKAAGGEIDETRLQPVEF